MSAGSGWDPQEFAAVGADYEHRGAVTEECVEIWKHAFHFDVRSGTIDELFELVERFAEEVLPAARELEPQLA